MSRFTNELTITQMSGTSEAWRLWRVHEAVVYEVGAKGSGRFITVPPTFVSDGPSVPRFLWAVMPVWGTYGRAGIVHDYLVARISAGRPHREACTRSQADAIFYEAMAVLGVRHTTRWLLYLGVRLGTLFGIRGTMIDHNRELLAKEPDD